MTDTSTDGTSPILDSLPPPGMFSALAGRMVTQHEALTANGADFTYDRNGLRLGIAALEDEVRELYAEWADGKRNLSRPDTVAGIRHEALDIAAVAMLIYRNVPAQEQP